MSFYDVIRRYAWNDVHEQIKSKTSVDVEEALHTTEPGLNDFQALVSPAAAPYLEAMAKKSRASTQKRFGRTIQLYIPLYLSNYCSNTCVYCGFNHKNSFNRTILSEQKVLEEAQRIKAAGFEHVLLVTGEDSRRCGVDYISTMVKKLRALFALVSIEVQPLSTEEYTSLVSDGLHTVYIYQETYNETNYKLYHPGGKKSDYTYRIQTPERLGIAGVHKIGLGVLLGLENWRVDSFFTALHLKYLEKNYWQSKYSISFPRLRPHAGVFQPNNPVTERDLVQLICAYRICNEQVELSLSTRESPLFRDNMLSLGVTAFSAGSKTNPGGYSESSESLEQFSVHDDRSPEEVAQVIKKHGYDVVWKDWGSYMQL